MRKILMTREQKLKLAEKFHLTEATVSEIVNFKRQNYKHSYYRSYAVNKLGARVFISD